MIKAKSKKRKQTMSNAEKSLIALFTGALVGTIVGILLAPEEGVKTRKKLAKRAEGWKKDLEDRWEEGSDKFREFADSATSEAEKYGKKVSESFSGKK